MTNNNAPDTPDTPVAPTMPAMPFFGGAQRANRYPEPDPPPSSPNPGIEPTDGGTADAARAKAPVDVPTGERAALRARRGANPPPPPPSSPGGVRSGGVTRVSTLAASETLPAQWGWRARVRKGTGGLVKLAPDEQELAHRRAVTTIRQATWTRAVNVVVANPKGGVGKTPTAVILGGILGQVRGGYVAAWEAVESIGTLTRRAEGEPVRGLAELLAGVGDIRSAGHLGGYTAPQTSHADVIGSVGRRRVLTGEDIVAVRQVLDTYYRMSVTDTGNNPGHPAFLAALRTADAAVLPCLTSIDALDGLEEALTVIGEVDHETGDDLRSRVVVVLGHDGGPEDPDIATALRQRLSELEVAAVLEVPFDPAIRLGGEITLSTLSVASQRAWTAVAAAVVQVLRSAPNTTDLVARLRTQLSPEPPTEKG